MNRVVITGMGAISPVGSDIETIYESLSTGRCGVGKITRFESRDLKIRVAAEVKDFDPERYGISRGDTRRMDLFTQYAMAAAVQRGAAEPQRAAAHCLNSPKQPLVQKAERRQGSLLCFRATPGNVRSFRPVRQAEPGRPAPAAAVQPVPLRASCYLDHESP